jgi:maltooligosyltrehalose trehalohydrolase
VDPGFKWTDEFWCGRPLQDYSIYELHIGTLTPEGTFDAAISRLDDIKELGVTAVEVMPVAQFPGKRNWGYDGVLPYAVQNSYGGPKGFKRFVDACHQKGLAVLLDVVYNHIGPEGKRLSAFGPFFTEKYKSPWGPVFNFDDRGSDGVRRFFVDNAVYWIEEFHLDGLRLDAVSAIFDDSPVPFLEDLGDAVRAYSKKTNRLVYTIAETAANNPKFVTQKELGGMGLDGQWNFDFHHALHALLTSESSGYYQDFGSVADLAKAYSNGYVLTGDYSNYYGRRHGGSSEKITGRRLVVYSQNHDETGNRPGGDRFGAILSFEAQKLAAGATLLSPFIPLLFMGEEYGETNPFCFFVDPEDEDIGKATREGRKREAKDFGWEDEGPDPLSPATMKKSILQWDLRLKGRHRKLLSLYQTLLKLRQEHPALKVPKKETAKTRSFESEKCLVLERSDEGQSIFAIFHFGDEPRSFSPGVAHGTWTKLLDSADSTWDGAGAQTPPSWASSESSELMLAAKSFVLYEKIG